MKGRSEKVVPRAKNAKDAKIEFDKKTGPGRGLCELSVLGAMNFLKLDLCNNSLVVSDLRKTKS
jgi:hypothetical protein